MPLVTPKEFLQHACQNKYAVAAFATHNMEIMRAVVAAAEEMEAPIIFQTTPSTMRYVGIKNMVAMARAAAEQANVPIALHLDHGDSFETVGMSKMFVGEIGQNLLCWLVKDRQIFHQPTKGASGAR